MVRDQARPPRPPPRLTSVWMRTGAPAGFGNTWYSSGYNSYGYGYGGPSYWGTFVPIYIWTRPYGCYGMYNCNYYHHRSNNTQQQNTAAAEKVTSPSRRSSSRPRAVGSP